jgi:hypothetical protein
MTKATLILHQKLEISERFKVELKVFLVDCSEKFPEGIKVSFALLDVFENVLRLLIDNHEPFGFHVHEELPKNRNARRLLATKEYQQALNEFWRLVNGIIENEN